ncbi:MAG TPA: globin [Acidimicrobiales bacterium]|nr:globin [Acidimicrobiales bacterium]
MSAAPEVTLYERVGGDQFFARLVADFYAAVGTDPVLRPLYPADLGPPAARLAAFLVQYWGGPTTYSDERGHPRLRMRHAPFVIGAAERAAWWRHMSEAVAASGATPAEQAELLGYFERAADAMVNAGG